MHTGLGSAVCAAEHLAFRLDTMTDHAAAAVGAVRSQRVDGALEAVEHVFGFVYDDE